MTTIVTAIFAVFTAIGEWIVSAFGIITPLFFAEGALTLVGTLSVMALGISVILLIMNYVRDFIRFR